MKHHLFFDATFLTAALFFATVLTALVWHFVNAAHQLSPVSAIPYNWSFKVKGWLLITSLLGFITLSSITTKRSLEYYGSAMSAEQTAMILEAIGEMNTARILHAVQKKLEETGSSSLDVDVDADLYLLEETIIEIIYSGRECAGYMNIVLPNGESLGDIMMDIYSEEQIRSDIRRMATAIFKKNCTKREKLEAVRAHIKKKQFELSKTVLVRGYR